MFLDFDIANLILISDIFIKQQLFPVVIISYNYKLWTVNSYVLPYRYATFHQYPSLGMLILCSVLNLQSKIHVFWLAFTPPRTSCYHWSLLQVRLMVSFFFHYLCIHVGAPFCHVTCIAEVILWSDIAHYNYTPITSCKPNECMIHTTS